MEGARWDVAQGVITDSRLKELFPTMPVINIRVGFEKEINVSTIVISKTKNYVIYFCPGYNSRQTRFEKYLRMSSVQDENKRTDLRLDIQFKIERQTIEMDSSRSCTTLTSLKSFRHLKG